ncbi:alpha/beta fold hydrolase [Parasphaerochaeta coccoides]|uniref:Alpha/beta hydrolase fold protein n=1 Tax=Parasphaerochaeta coccoides (strain ATCC BAA-1237 / DSM 17374 / SPN1) TaxID=760011 RepID=F4GLK6_PARC1|nr:alpha/beta hydrolase [Parasphaerochaeta coccoides]AEC01976.1 alpha/beta hydrolase fold protein [Parasphaerochaeta coccoides DSM 17374]
MNILINGINLYYEEYGSGIPVLCLHGFYVDSHLMKGCLEPVFESKIGYKRIYLDLVGMGKTPSHKSVINSDDMLKIVNAFINKIIGDASFILFGESYGGYLSLGLVKALKDKILGLFLICPCTIGDKERRNLPPKQIVKQESFAVNTVDKNNYSSFLKMAVIANQYTWNRYKKEILVGINNADVPYLDFIYSNGYALSCESEFCLIEFNNPTTILLGKQDHIVGYKDALRLESNFSRSSFAIIDSTGHNMQIEKPELFSGFVEEFLRNFS